MEYNLVTSINYKLYYLHNVARWWS